MRSDSFWISWRPRRNPYNSEVNIAPLTTLHVYDSLPIPAIPYNASIYPPQLDIHINQIHQVRHIRAGSLKIRGVCEDQVLRAQGVGNLEEWEELECGLGGGEESCLDLDFKTVVASLAQHGER